ncbi:MAG: hypothetical protein Q8L57_01740 [bacterium]|nr:hypothetical protein [bacterium]
MVIQSWADVIVASFQQMWTGFIAFLPVLIGALIVFIVGLIVAKGLGHLVEKMIDALKIDRVLERLGLRAILARAELRLHSGRFLGELVKWFLILVFALAAADILGLVGVTDFIRQEIIPVISKVIIAVLILIAGVLVASILEKVVRASVAASGVRYGNFLGIVTRWIVLVFAFWTVFLQLDLALFIPFSAIITGIIAMLAIAGGLAFGLGGRDMAAQLLEELRKQISEKKQQ